MLKQIHRCQWDSLQLQHDELLTGVRGDVTGVTLWAAVLLIWAAHSILQRAAAPLARRQPAAGGVFGTLNLPVAVHRPGISFDAGGGWKLGVPWDHHFPFNA